MSTDDEIDKNSSILLWLHKSLFRRKRKKGIRLKARTNFWRQNPVQALFVERDWDGSWVGVGVGLWGGGGMDNKSFTELDIAKDQKNTF